MAVLFVYGAVSYLAIFSDYEADRQGLDIRRAYRNGNVQISDESFG